MNDSHWFWHLLALACVRWYLTITDWVAIKGALDIRKMVKGLDEQQ